MSALELSKFHLNPHQRATVGFMKRSFSKKTKCFNLLFFAQINLISVVDDLESKNIQL